MQIYTPIFCKINLDPVDYSKFTDFVFNHCDQAIFSQSRYPTQIYWTAIIVPKCIVWLYLSHNFIIITNTQLVTHMPPIPVTRYSSDKMLMSLLTPLLIIYKNTKKCLWNINSSKARLTFYSTEKYISIFVYNLVSWLFCK